MSLVAKMQGMGRCAGLERRQRECQGRPLTTKVQSRGSAATQARRGVEQRGPRGKSEQVQCR